MTPFWLTVYILGLGWFFLFALIVDKLLDAVEAYWKGKVRK